MTLFFAAGDELLAAPGNGKLVYHFLSVAPKERGTNAPYYEIAEVELFCFFVGWCHLTATYSVCF